MGQLNEEPVVKVEAKNKKELSDRYEFTERWFEALINTEYTIANNESEHTIVWDPAEKRQILEIGVYEGGSSCFWSDFYLDHEESSLICIDPFTGSEEHLRNPENYAGLAKLERTARGNIAKSKNAAKVEILKGYSQDVFAEIDRRVDSTPFIDILYIDGAHDSSAVSRDVCLYVPLVKPGGYVIFDDYAHPDVRRAVDMSLNAFACFEFAMFTGWQLVGKVSEVASSHGATQTPQG